MDDITAIRRRNLELVLAMPRLARLRLEKHRAAVFGWSASVWSQIRNPDYNIGDTSARLIEERMKLDPGWMDQIHDPSIQAEHIQGEWGSRDIEHTRNMLLDPVKIVFATSKIRLIWQRYDIRVAYNQEADPGLFCMAYQLAMDYTPEGEMALEEAVLELAKRYRGKSVEDDKRAQSEDPR